SAASNHFQDGSFATRFCNWRFIHRPCLDCVLQEGLAMKTSAVADARTRTKLVPNHCRIHAAAWQKRNNAVRDCLVKAISHQRLRTISMNRQVPNTNSNLRPDIVIVNENEVKITIVDVSIPFESKPQALSRARQAKQEKHNGIAEEWYETPVDALFVGAIGTWDPDDEEDLRKCAGYKNNIISSAIAIPVGLPHPSFSYYKSNFQIFFQERMCELTKANFSFEIG
ncbi:hypothetical protein JTB14_023615, partial [Gonioctena quinquepunctata]